MVSFLRSLFRQSTEQYFLFFPFMTVPQDRQRVCFDSFCLKSSGFLEVFMGFALYPEARFLAFAVFLGLR